MYAYQHTSLSLFVDWLRLIAPYIGFCMQPIARCLCRISSKSHYIKLTYDLGKIWSIKDTKNKEDILKNVVTKQFWLPLTSIILYEQTNQKTLRHFSKYLLLCYTKESKSYRFGTTWGWVNDYTFTLGWTILLTGSFYYSSLSFKN